VNAFLAAALTRVMRATVPIPTLASASVLHSATVGGSVVSEVLYRSGRDASACTAHGSGMC